MPYLLPSKPSDHLVIIDISQRGSRRLTVSTESALASLVGQLTQEFSECSRGCLRPNTLHCRGRPFMRASSLDQEVEAREAAFQHSVRSHFLQRRTLVMQNRTARSSDRFDQLGRRAPDLDH